MRHLAQGHHIDTYVDLRAKALGYDDYAHYLRSDHWQTFCATVRKTLCWCCGRSQGHLHVHHTTYARFGSEEPGDVITVCKGCHLAIHALSRTGIALDEAHIVYRRRRIQRGARHKRPRWVSWFQLLNKSKQQTIGELRLFLEEHGLLEGEEATPKAFALGFVRLEDGEQRWNLKKYLGFVSAWKSIEKRREQGRGISRTVARLASGR